MKVLAIGASRNIGYYTSVRLLGEGATVTFLLRNPATFNADEVIQGYVKSGHARLIQGDGLVEADVQRAWDEAAAGDRPGEVDLLLFTLGINPNVSSIRDAFESFSLRRGMLPRPADACSRAWLNAVRTVPLALRGPNSPLKIVAITSTGCTDASHASLPLVLRIVYPWLLQVPHRDKRGMERVCTHLRNEVWHSSEADALPTGWQSVPGTPAAGELPGIVVVRPALLTSGECKEKYRVSPEDKRIGLYTVSRKDVAHFIATQVLKDWKKWVDKSPSVGY